MGKVAKQKNKKANPEPPLPENRLDDTTVKKATAALVKYIQKSGDSSDKKQLFSKTETVTLQFTLQKLPDPKHKPYLIPLKHTLFNPEDGVELCLFTKDPSEPVKDKLESKPVPGFTEVIGYTKLRKDYKQYQAKRELLHRYDAFFCGRENLSNATSTSRKGILWPEEATVPRQDRYPSHGTAACKSKRLYCCLSWIWNLHGCAHWMDQFYRQTTVRKYNACNSENC
eukprot:gb/GECG01003913.1/.p1 GENE.gb/GECG01003913.1/~~gb/GECG01003913.1/.p1  ORF type:complete len:227 (+),score=22.18 gb/GECG01003913.1/:1-681(+)